jgi:hypothetical protein
VKFDDYQTRARETDRIPCDGVERLYYLVFGLNEEAGNVARLIKKAMRNDIALESIRPDIAKNLGGINWYLSAIADHFGLNLGDIAAQNLDFIERRWLNDSGGLFSPEQEFLSEDGERFPDNLVLLFDRVEEEGLIKLKLCNLDGTQIGDTVDDNEYEQDDYRFHDVLHVMLLAHFRWSPVFRKLLGLKRKSNPEVDRVEDGAKARDIEEALCRWIFVYLEDNNFLEGASAMDTSFLTGLRSFCRGREIVNIPERAWERAIFNAAQVIRQLQRVQRGYIVVDATENWLSFSETPPA